MAIRPGRCYHHITQKPWTRVSQRTPRRSYVKGVPVSKIHQFEMGGVAEQGTFPLIYHLVAGQDVQLRSNCMEAARTICSGFLQKNLGEKGFFMKIRKYPHHVLRENPLATGAGADRFSQGMRRSWGNPIGQAARLMKGEKILTIRLPAGRDELAKEALDRAAKKLPGKCRAMKDQTEQL
jgi:large subunit ribosomal protein L10e